MSTQMLFSGSAGEVLEPNAGTLLASVVDVNARRQWPVSGFVDLAVDENVSEPLAAFAAVEAGVAAVVDAAERNPSGLCQCGWPHFTCGAVA